MTDTPSVENDDISDGTLRLPVLPLFETVVFPHMMQPIQVGRQPSLVAVDEAVKQRPHRIVLLTQNEAGKQEVGPDDLMEIGVLATIGPMFRLPDGSVQLLALGALVVADPDERKDLLTTLEVVDRLRRAHQLLSEEVEVLELKSRISSEVQKNIDKTQREYLLREQMKEIQRELGELDPEQAEAAEWRTKIDEAGMPEKAKEKALKEVDRLSRIPSASPEQGVIRTYVDWLVSLPWGVETDDNLDLVESEKVLNEDHYGLEKPKERILEYMAVRKLASKIRSPRG